MYQVSSVTTQVSADEDGARSYDVIARYVLRRNVLHFCSFLLSRPAVQKMSLLGNVTSTISSAPPVKEKGSTNLPTLLGALARSSRGKTRTDPAPNRA